MKARHRNESLDVALSPGAEEAVLRELTHALMTETPATALGVCVVVLLIAVPAWQYVSSSAMAWYLAVCIGFQMVSLTVGLLYRSAYRSRQPTEMWRRCGIWLAGGCGLAISVGSILLYNDGGDELLVYLLMFLTGLAASSVGNNSNCPPALTAYLLTSSPVFAIYILFVSDGLLVYVSAVGLLLHAALTWYIIGQPQVRTIRTSLELQHQKDALLEQLRIQTQVAEEGRRTAEKVSAEKSRFFASASHDLRQPVHALNLYASLLRTTRDNSERLDLTERITQCVATLDDLFNSLLTVSRAEATAQQGQAVRPMPLNVVIDSMTSQFAGAATQKGLALCKSPTSAWVMGEPIAVERILGNLLSNAIRFTEHGRILVGVRRRGIHVELQVIDTGIGIAEDVRSQIFTEFFQVANPERNAAQGFGLGLVIVQRLCKAMGYEVLVDSRPGKGSRFSVRMPRANAVQQLAPEPVQSTGRLEQPVSLILVDDDALIRDAMARIFTQWGVDADIFSTSADALEHLHKTTRAPDCLLLDLRLAESTNGLELAQQMQTRIGRRLPIAILTGEAEGPMFDQVRSHGFSILQKPVKLMRLRAFISAARPTLLHLDRQDRVRTD